jgi:RNA polymerase sigma-70 factor (ECF subfamily)
VIPDQSAAPEWLLQSARAGDNDALGQLLERYRCYLALLARLEIGRRLRTKVDDGDLVQEVFLQAFRSFPRFRGNTEGELLAWLRRILATVLANQCRRFLGTQGRNLRLEEELADILDRSSQSLGQPLQTQGSTPSEHMVRQERAVLLANALDQLPAAYREVIILAELEGRPFPEVAQRLGRSVDSVKNSWARALVRLKRILGEEP